LSGLAALQLSAEQAVPLLRERRSTLIAAAVTGQIDVRGVVEPEAA
jgi:type I restriction enzyme S subunit